MKRAFTPTMTSDADKENMLVDTIKSIQMETKTRTKAAHRRDLTSHLIEDRLKMSSRAETGLEVEDSRKYERAGRKMPAHQDSIFVEDAADAQHVRHQQTTSASFPLAKK